MEELDLQPAIQDMGHEIYQLGKEIRKIKKVLLKIDKRVVWCEENIKSNLLKVWNKEDSDTGVHDYV